MARPAVRKAPGIKSPPIELPPIELPTRAIPILDAPINLEKIRLKERLVKEREEDSKLVTGVFQDNERPGGNVKFNFKKYKEDRIQEYHFFDGKEYTIPRAVAKHLNNNCCWIREAYDKSGLMAADGKPMKSANAIQVHRFTFKYMD